jgi:1-deoxy-D-xylulose-5-phosphate reductoisomerase
MVGFSGLAPTLAAIRAGKDIALANKETLEAAGAIVMDEAKAHGVRILPVDSEHSAIFQCLQAAGGNKVAKIHLTASGGPFRTWEKAAIAKATASDALRHPNWSMGSKITIDSSTLMNKGLEFIEAMRLFDLRPEQIEIVVHRQSVVHSAVCYNDSSVIAQIGVPDMKIPIQYALLYPDRFECPTRPRSLTDYGTLTFAKPDFDTFDCLTACIKAAGEGGILPAAVNGANEVAVRAFLDGRIKFLQIGEIVTHVLGNTENRPQDSLETVLAADRAARDFAEREIERLSN